MLDPTTVCQVLQASGFLLPSQQELFEIDRLADAARQVGFPVIMKVIGPLHKTDVGGVQLGLVNEASVVQAWNRLMAIQRPEDVLLQPMIQGQEMILGASREGDFGHLVMFGLGGIHAEVSQDVQFALAPLTAGEARQMIERIRSRPLLDGVRGGTEMEVKRHTDFLVRHGCLVTDFPAIGEIDLNPIKGTGDRLVVVDCRIIMVESP